MSSLTRKMLPVFALAATMSAAQAQTTGAAGQDHDAHHPDGAAAATQAQPAPVPAPAPAQPAPGARPGPMNPGMTMNMDQMRPMMGGMMGQQDGQSGMMGPGMMGPGMMGPGMMPMMRQMMMGQPGGMGAMGAMGLPFEHVEGRIAFLKAELKITDAQAPQWNAFADALRANAKAHQAVHEQMGKGGMPSSWPDRLSFQQKALSTRLDALKTLEAAAKPLYAVLTDEQKKLADQMLAGPMGTM